jgi:AAA15 family ATPase/GTPase
MSLYSIEIKNFRGISQIELNDFKSINLLVGKNNCGKTSLLEALFLSIGVSNPQLAITIDTFRGLLHNEIDDFQFIFFNLDPANEIEMNSQFVAPTQYRKLIIKPIYQNHDKSLDIKRPHEATVTSTVTVERKISGVEFEFSVKSIKQSKDVLFKSSLEFLSGTLKVQPAVGYIEKFLGVYINTRTMQQELYERLDKIIQLKAEKKFIKTLNVIDPRIVDISLGSKGMIYFDLGLDRRIPIQIMGDGIGRLLSILVTIAYYENGIVLIDEIENGFHASTLNLLWSSIQDVALAYNVQVFATTHSLECVRTFSNTFSHDLLGNDLIRLYRLERSKENKFKAIKYTGEVLQSSLESNWEIR